MFIVIFAFPLISFRCLYLQGRHTILHINDELLNKPATGKQKRCLRLIVA